MRRTPTPSMPAQGKYDDGSVRSAFDVLCTHSQQVGCLYNSICSRGNVPSKIRPMDGSADNFCCEGISCMGRASARFDQSLVIPSCRGRYIVAASQPPWNCKIGSFEIVIFSVMYSVVT